jgi:glycosyltransferase involved in cell wall biosynthesis
MADIRLTVVQILPALDAGGVERGTVEVARALVEAGHRAIVVSRGGRQVSALDSAGAEHVALDIGRKSPWTLRHALPLARLLAESGAQILHARSRLPAWIGMAARRILGGRAPHFVTTVHGPYSVNAYSAVMTRSERVIAISRFIADYLRANYPRLEERRIRVIPRGVSPEEFPRGYQPPAAWRERWRREHPQLSGRALLLFPARITRWKGQQDFIELIGRLRDRGEDVHGLLVGGLDDRRNGFLRELQRQVRERKLEDRVSMLGHRDDIREIMSVSRAVLVMTGVPEAFGRTALESVSLGVPVIGYAHGGTTEILRSTFPGGLVPPGDIDAAADRVAAVLRQPPDIIPRHPFSLRRMLDDTLALYQELASHRP